MYCTDYRTLAGGLKQSQPLSQSLEIFSFPSNQVHTLHNTVLLFYCVGLNEPGMTSWLPGGRKDAGTITDQRGDPWST